MWMFWNDVVGKYSACLLTLSSDKLAASSGVAKHVERIFGDEYCDGLWRSELAQQLLWICPQREPLPPRSSPYRAPSWSWACQNGEIIPATVLKRSYYRADKMLVEIDECTIVSPIGDPTSVIASAVLRLRARLISVQLNDHTNPEKSLTVNGIDCLSQSNLEIHLDCELPTLQLHCVPILVHDFSSDWTLCCLLLAPKGASRGQFQRFGTLTLLGSSLGMGAWKGFPDFQNEDWLEYESVDDEGLYTISII